MPVPLDSLSPVAATATAVALGTECHLDGLKGVESRKCSYLECLNWVSSVVKKLRACMQVVSSDDVKPFAVNIAIS